MDKFDRQTQLEFLSSLNDIFPDKIRNNEQLKRLLSVFPDNKTAIANLLYLEGHGLITSGLRLDSCGYSHVWMPAITINGIDFLRNDGGLSAILKVQTIKFHHSTLTAIEDIIRIANIPEDQKKGLISKLRELPSDAIKHLTLQLLTQGVMNIPAALPLIEKALR
ncbi:hypothetical protein KJE01_23310 [Escherichia marmotae]|nr:MULTISPECIES: hypothetical protein [Escherichia]EEQ6524473.1 hypothetical protein [Escherichia coli]EEQ9687120.1 hypothetical protein [Escherichia coli]EEQ9773718.1 hypothetical protein [Escherichia coli]EFC9844737.1 hypothetical protein [Escherichia coli]EFC9932419.1 hypothetical protein [Escherichia coli]